MTRDKNKAARGAADLDSESQALLDKKSGAPLYVEVASTLRTAIVRGIYPVGSRIPTEEDLCERFQVSRHTVREALRRLREDGLITSRQGGRPIVVPPSALNAVRLFSAEMGKDFFDYTMGTRLIIESMEVIPLNKALAVQLDLVQGEKWLRVHGYRRSPDDTRNICWNEYFVREEYAAVGRLLPRHVGPIIPLIEDLFSEKICEVHQSMTAIAMAAEHAPALQVAADSPALKIVSRCETVDQKIALIAISIHPGGDPAYSIRLRDRG